METKNIGALWLIALGVVGAIIAGWFLYWQVAESADSHRQDIIENSRGVQIGLISQSRDLVTAFGIGKDGGQLQYLRNQFCTIYVDIKNPPQDLQDAHESICS